MFSMDLFTQKFPPLRRDTTEEYLGNEAALKKARSSLKQYLIKNYSTSQSFFYLKTVTALVQKKEKDSGTITLNDCKFDDDKEHFQKFYNRIQSLQELPELFEYYKYYTQESICFLNREFQFLAVHHERKKAALYFQLKKQLNITDSAESLSNVTKMKPEKCDVGNVLSGLNLSFFKNEDESYCINQTLKKLTKYFGPSIQRPIGEIDSEFKFMAHGNKKKNFKVQSFLHKKNKILESTNTSMRNQKTTKGSHKRYISCQLTAIHPKYESGGNPQIPKKSKNLKRRKSADCLQYDSNLKNTPKPYQQFVATNSRTSKKNSEKNFIKKTMASSKIPLIKKNKQSPLVTLKTSTTYLTQVTLEKEKQKQVKNTIEHLRTQIRQQKQNINLHTAKKGCSYKKNRK